MHRFVRKSVSLTQIKSWAAYSPTVILSPPCLQSHKSFSTDVSNITARDLINTCELSHKIVTRLESSKRPNSVLTFLQNEGFSRTQIETIVSKYPSILFNCVEKTLKPKIDFFRSVGCSGADIAKIFANSLMFRSLKNHLIPSFELLRTTLGGQQNAVDAIKRYPTLIGLQLTKNFALNVEILRNIGTPHSRLMKMLARNTAYVVASNAPHRFRKDVEFLMEMGFDPSLSSFEYAVFAKGCLTGSGWEDRLKFFRSLGFSNEETICMFKKQPLILAASKEKIRAAVEFFISTFHWSPTQLSKQPNVFRYSLGKRIILRCSVLQILASRSMINKSVMVSSLVAMAERDFLEKYITNYKDEVPELLDAYHGILPKYFSSEWSFAQFHLPEYTEFSAAFGSQNTVIIVGMDGRYAIVILLLLPFPNYAEEARMGFVCITVLPTLHAKLVSCKLL